MKKSFTGWSLWGRGLISAAIGGASTAVTTMIVAPSEFNFEEGLGKVAAVAGVSAIVAVANYLKSSPLPEYKPEDKPEGK